ncbi:unnamed protein product [Ectocarpus sp. 4 AP-2014]
MTASHVKTIPSGTGDCEEHETKQLPFSHWLLHGRDRNSVVSGNMWTATGSEVPGTLKLVGNAAAKITGHEVGMFAWGIDHVSPRGESGQQLLRAHTRELQAFNQAALIRSILLAFYSN